MFGLGYTREFEEIKMGKKTLHSWRVKRGKTEVGKGLAEGLREAEEAANKCLIEAMNKGEAKANIRKEHVARLRRLAKVRPYMTAGFCAYLFNGFTKARIVKEASDIEREWWDKEENPAKKALPTHGSALTSARVVEQLWESMEAAGILVIEEGGKLKLNRVRGWAYGMFGKEIFDAE
jgi:hypothetical protein